MAEIKPCPKCGETPIVGYACGEFFIMPLSQPLFMCPCSSFISMHSSEEREIDEWNEYVERWKSNKMNEILQMAIDENKTLKNEIKKLKDEAAWVSPQDRLPKEKTRVLCAKRDAITGSIYQEIWAFSRRLKNLIDWSPWNIGWYHITADYEIGETEPEIDIEVTPLEDVLYWRELPELPKEAHQCNT